jgi:hypothetical protein
MKLNQTSQLLYFTLLSFGFGMQAFADELPTGLGKQVSGDELPPGLELAISNPAIPVIVDATVLRFNKEGHGEIKVNKVYKAMAAKGKFVPPKWVRGYGYVGSDKIAPFRIVSGGRPGRFLFFLDGDLLYSTYNNRFPLREGKNGTLEVGVGFNGGGGPWKTLKEIVRRIPLAPTKKNKK